MKVYVASAAGQAQRVVNAIDLLRRAGFVVECDWASKYLAEGRNATESGFNNEMIESVRRCDVLVLMLPGKRGAHVEFGVAIGMCKPCLVLYSEESDLISFHRCEGVELFTSGMALMNRLFDLRNQLEPANG